MANQKNVIRRYTANDEAASTRLVACTKCGVKAIPRAIVSTDPKVGGDTHCPNCGHIHSRANH